VVYGRTLLRVFAAYDQRSSSWRTYRPLEVEDSTEYLGTWPRAGMTRSGRAYERVRLGRPTDESESSSWATSQKPRIFSLLPAPVASDGRGGQSIEKRKAGGHQVDLSDLVVSLVPILPNRQISLLPTPLASNGTKGSPKQRSSNGSLTLPSAMIELAGKQAA
jgi:hypothetical protein